MSQATIIKSAIKLEKFKTLMAHTIATGLTFLPIMGVYGLFVSDTVQQASVGLHILATFTGVALGVGQLVFLMYKNIGSHPIEYGPYQFAHKQFWQRMFDKPFIYLFKKQNEDIILRTRQILRQRELSQSDYDWLSETISQKQGVQPDLQKWVSFIGTHHHSYNSFETSTLKEKSAMSALEEAQQRAEQLNPGYLTNYIDIKNQDSLLNKNLSLIDFLKQSQSYEYSLELKNSIKFKSQILANPKFPGLKPLDYSEFKALVKSEKEFSIDTALDLLLACDYPVVDWEKIQEIIQTNYKSHDRNYISWMSSIDKKLVTQQAIQGSSAILNALSDPDLAQKNTPQIETGSALSALPLASALNKNAQPLDSFCKLINYSSLALPNKWAELKDEYNVMYQLKDRIGAHEFIEFNSQLTTVLKLLIGVDVGFKSSNQSYPEGSLKLVQENLDILINKAQAINLSIKDSLNRDLEVASRYQNNKKMSSSM